MAKTNQEERRKAPILRFKGFTNDWEQVELNEIAKKRIEKNNNLVNNNVLSNSAIYGIIKQNEYFDKTIANNINNYYVVHKDDFVYNPRISNHAPFGPISRNNFNESGIMSPLYLVFYFSTKSLNNYLEMYFKSSKWYKFMYKNGNSGARADRFVIKDNDFFKMEVKIPNDKNEQNKISQILNVLNNLITLYERKSKLFSQMKEYLLDNLFAENEYPNLRFKGFTNAWEQRKLKELVNHKSGTSIEKYFSINGTYKVISIGSYGLNNKYIDQGIRAEENEVTKKKVVQKNQLTMVLNDKTVSGQIIGRCLLINKNNTYVVNQRTEIIIPNKEINSNYAYYYLNGPFRKKVKKISQGGTQIYVNYSSVEKQKFFYPYNYQEQIKIKNILKNLDDYITFYENKYCQFKQIKKELLDTMFI